MRIQYERPTTMSDKYLKFLPSLYDELSAVTDGGEVEYIRVLLLILILLWVIGLTEIDYMPHWAVIAHSSHRGEA
jgi:hypothetical protein